MTYSSSLSLIRRMVWWVTFCGMLLSVCHCTPVRAQTSFQAWGDNSSGQIGDGTTILRPAPVAVQNLTDVIAFAAQRYHNLALRANGTVWAWGDNESGQLGDGTYSDRTQPVPVSTLSQIVAVAVGGYHSLAVKADRTMWAWGWNSNGQLGDESYSGGSAVPVRVLGLTDMVSGAAGFVHSLAVKRDGTVWAWGQNFFYGQLGDGSYVDRHAPVRVVGLTNVIAVSGGVTHSVALKQDGTVWTWGANGSGELGDGTTAYRTVAAPVPGLAGVVAVAAGGYFTLALKADGTVWAWGANLWGQLGDGTETKRLTPVQVSNLTGVIALGAGSAHSLAVKQDGTVWAWGLGSYGQMGNGNYNGSLVPVQVVGVTGARSVAAGEAHSLAMSGSVSGNVSGTIGLQGIVGGAPAHLITFSFLSTSGNPVNKTVIIGASGTYLLSGIPAGTYSVRIKSPKYLAKRLNVTVQAGGTTTLNVTLKAGDFNNDNAVDVADILAIINHYNKTQGNPGYLEACDFNSDGANDVTDLLTVIGNYNQLGD